MIQVTVPLPFNHSFTYLSPIPLEKGDIVTVPFGKRIIKGVVWDTESNEIPREQIKSIIDKISFIPRFKPEFMRFLEMVADYNMMPLGSVLAMSLSVKKALEEEYSSEANENNNDITIPTLSESQKIAADKLIENLGNGFIVTLLEGVTGSGKTEVYSEAIRHTKATALILLPEITLTSQLISRLAKQFKDTPILWHSGLTPKERRINWQKIARGECKIIIGARSALFLPIPDLSLIIVDEEHESAYKQEDGVIYHARDMAILRAKCENIPIVLSSATPSIETILNVDQGKYKRIILPTRYKDAAFPSIALIDMREEALEKESWISPTLREAIANTLRDHEQVLLFLNRRGYAPLSLCRICGHRMQCPECSSWLVHHQAKKKLLCHHCGYSIVPPENCPSCNHENSMAACGPGVERIHDEASNLYSNANIAVMTSDVISSAKKASILIKNIEEKKIDILIGTQMIAKGHHFPHLTLVGVIDADLGLEGGDLRASEKCYQLLHQVSGRAGRESRPGKVYMQTYNPAHPVMKGLLAHNREEFVKNEIAQRKLLGMPPFSRMMAIIISGMSESQVRKIAKEIVLAAPSHEGFKIYGPAPAPLLKLRGNYRYRLLIKAHKNLPLQQIAATWLSAIQIPRLVKLKIDIDPYNFL